MKRNRTYRIRTGVNDGTPVISFAIDSSIETYEILSLKISQTNAYRLMSSDKGVIAGRVLANNGFGIPNARVSVFVQYEETEDLEKSLLYRYSSVRSVDDSGVRYNLLPSESDDTCHQTVGTFPNKRMVLDDDSWIDVFDKYYRYTTRTNASGDYMIYGVPVGQQTVHMDVDLSDIGPLSQKPRDMMAQGYSAGMFENPNKFKGGTNLGSLVQVKSQDSSVYVYPFWGDTTDSATNAAITRHDISVNYTFKPTCVFMGSVISDTGENSMSKKCVGAKNQGKMSEMMAGEGKIEMIRKTFDGNVEEFSVQGNQLINGDGVWCYQIPMNLDYVMTDEYGNTVLSDNPEKGIPTRARVRFRISMTESPNDGTARKRARHLVPNNPHLIEDDYPAFCDEKKPDYEFGTNTKDENFRDLMWNNVYTVKSYIPRIQKSNLPNNLRHLGIKTVNHPGGHNPMPFNNLRIRMNFTYRFMCALIKVFVTLTGAVNRVISMINYSLFKIAQGFISITRFLKIRSLGSFWGKKSNKEKYWTIQPYKNNHTNPYSLYIDEGISTSTDDKLQDNDDDDEDNGNTVSYRGAIAMLGMIGIIAQGQPQNDETGKFKYIVQQIGEVPMVTEGGKKIGVKGFAAFLLAVVHQIGCGIRLNSLCEDENGEEISATPGTIEKLTEIFNDVNKYIKIGVIDTCDTDLAALYNCVENELAQENEVTSFNFYNDWINGVLYFPLWYRKIKPKRRFLGIRIKAKDQWCSADTTWIRASSDRRQLKVYDTCAMKTGFNTNTSTPMGETIKPIEDSWDTVDVAHSRADSETGIERMKFNSYEERNCYGYRCDKYARSYMPMRRGLMQERETMLGDLVYYYKPCEYNARYTSDLITLFATDIVLLGSLSDCDIHGVPQFFKALEDTTYNMPPDLMSETYEYRQDLSNYEDERDSQFIDGDTRETEYTGADWGNLGADQTGMRPEYGGYVPVPGLVVPTAMEITYETNENIYDNGGLFYGLTCFDAFTKPKSCINLARICEFGVSLDESQEILSSQAVSENPSSPDEEMYSTLTPDGFISYDEIYDMDYRSMFATLNANLLRTKLNYATGLTEYDFNHLYIDNFDGVMSELMRSPSVTGGWTEKSEYTQRANYVGNHNLEKSSDSYLNFRFGDYQKSNGRRLYYYDYDASIGKVGPVGHRSTISSADRMPRYENSFYFYFGLHEGKTAIDSFYAQYYADCANDARLPQKYEIGAVASSVCPLGTMDGRIAFSFNAQPPFSIAISNADNSLETYHVEDMSVQEFYIGTLADQSELPGYRHARLYEDATGDEVEFLQNGTYKLDILTGDDEELHETVRLMPPQIECTCSVTDFTLRNNELDDTFQHLTGGGEYDWAAMFQEIANFKDDPNSPIVRPDGGVNRLTGGFVRISQASLENYTVSVEPASVSFFSDGDGHMLYTAPKATVLGNTVSGVGDGYLGNDGTDIYFGVPYGNQKYIITVTELCYDSQAIDSQIVETSNVETWTVMVRDGDFKMYVNGIDYDMMKSFRTGWSMPRLNPGPSEAQPSFSQSDMYGWNDLDNIGVYSNPTSRDPLPIRPVSVSDPVSTIAAIGDVLSYDYDGNGANRTIDGYNCSTPYSWNEQYCIQADEWDSLKSAITSRNTVAFTSYDPVEESETVETVENVTREVFEGPDGAFGVYYRCTIGGTVVLACTEYPSGNLTYEPGFSELTGPTMYALSQAVDTVNNIIEARAEFARTVKGAFRPGPDGGSLYISYRSTATPVEYLIAGGNEKTPPLDLSSPGTNGSTTVIDPSNPRVVFDPDLETYAVGFRLPTLDYDARTDSYIPFEPQSDLQTAKKIPYYTAVCNSLGIAIPGASSSVGHSSSVRVSDNFGVHKDNPIVGAMFGVHFFNNAMRFGTKRVVNLFNGMPKYGSQDLEPVYADALVIGYVMNGLPPVSVSLDGVQGLVSLSSTGQTEGYQRNDIRRLAYDSSAAYGEYQLSASYEDGEGNPILHQYFTLPRNRVVTVSDGYGPDYETSVVCDYSYDTAQIDLSDGTVPEMALPLSFTRSFNPGVRYHVFRYNGSNHPTDFAVQDPATQEWVIEDNSAMPGMFEPGYDFASHGGYVDTVTTARVRNASPFYRFTQKRDEEYGPDESKANPMFVVAEDTSTGTLAFSPVVEMAHMFSVHNFNCGAGQDRWTLYLLRRPVVDDSDTSRPGCDITDFKYITKNSFTLSFRYANSDGSLTTVVSYDVDPTDTGCCTLVDINVNDRLNSSPNTEYNTSGMALKIQVDRIPGFYAQDFGDQNGIPKWYMVWATDSLGVERRCIATTSSDEWTVTVSELP